MTNLIKSFTILLLVVVGLSHCLTNPCKKGSTQQFFAHPSSENKFIQCSQWGQMFVFSCPDGLKWNMDKLTCERISYVNRQIVKSNPNVKQEEIAATTPIARIVVASTTQRQTEQTVGQRTQPVAVEPVMQVRQQVQPQQPIQPVQQQQQVQPQQPIQPVQQQQQQQVQPQQPIQPQINQQPIQPVQQQQQQQQVQPQQPIQPQINQQTAQTNQQQQQPIQTEIQQIQQPTTTIRMQAMQQAMPTVQGVQLPLPEAGLEKNGQLSTIATTVASFLQTVRNAVDFIPINFGLQEQRESGANVRLLQSSCKAVSIAGSSVPIINGFYEQIKEGMYRRADDIRLPGLIVSLRNRWCITFRFAAVDIETISFQEIDNECGAGLQCCMILSDSESNLDLVDAKRVWTLNSMENRGRVESTMSVKCDTLKTCVKIPFCPPECLKKRGDCDVCECNGRPFFASSGSLATEQNGQVAPTQQPQISQSTQQASAQSFGQIGGQQMQQPVPSQTAQTGQQQFQPIVPQQPQQQAQLGQTGQFSPQVPQVAGQIGQQLPQQPTIQAQENAGQQQTQIQGGFQPIIQPTVPSGQFQPIVQSGQFGVPSGAQPPQVMQTVQNGFQPIIPQQQQQQLGQTSINQQAIGQTVQNQRIPIQQFQPVVQTTTATPVTTTVQVPVQGNQQRIVPPAFGQQAVQQVQPAVIEQTFGRQQVQPQQQSQLQQLRPQLPLQLIQPGQAAQPPPQQVLQPQMQQQPIPPQQQQQQGFGANALVINSSTQRISQLFPVSSCQMVRCPGDLVCATTPTCRTCNPLCFPKDKLLIEHSVKLTCDNIRCPQPFRCAFDTADSTFKCMS